MLSLSWSGFSQEQDAGREADSLIRVLATQHVDTLRTKVLYDLSEACIGDARYNEGVMYARELLAIASTLQQSRNKKRHTAGRIAEAQAWNCLGQVYFHQGGLSLSLDYYYISLAIYTALNDQSSMAELYTNVASDYAAQGDYNKSLDYYFRSLKIDERSGSESQIAVDCANIAAVLSDSGHRGRAAAYLFRATRLYKKLNDERSIALCLNNIGTNFQARADSARDEGNAEAANALYLTARTYLQQSLDIAEGYKDDVGIAIASENLGTVALYLDEPQKALDYLQSALAIYEHFAFKPETSYCLDNIGQTYQKMGRIADAERCFLRSLALAKETGSNDFIMQANNFLSSFYAETNRPAQALTYYREYIKYHDRIFNQQNSEKLVRTEMNYDFEKKQAQNKAQHEKQIVMLEGENRIQRQLRLFLFLVIGFCIVILFFVQRAYNSKKRLAALLAAEDSRKELLLQEVHHRINNNLQIISSLLSLQANSAEDERLNTYLKQSQNRIQSLSALHELLYQNNSTQQVNMRDYIDKILDFHRDVAGTLPAKVEIGTDVTDVPFPTKIAVPLALIINELVTNALKYAFAGRTEGRIDVLLHEADAAKGEWKLTIKDNGKGLGDATERRKGSLGLRLVTIMVKQIAAVLKTTEGPGAAFDVTFSIGG